MLPRITLAIVAVLLAGTAAAQNFLPDDPVLRDRDDLPIAKPGKIELSNAWDGIEHTLAHRPKGKVPAAQNVNTLGDVPDSSWLRNRIGMRPMSIGELARGPNRGSGPDTNGPLTVIRSKSGGITPGFTVRDSRGDVYFVKFDPARHFGLSTGADVVGSRFFHAMGYYVPENDVAYFRREQLRIGEGAMARIKNRKPRPMTETDLDEMLAGVARLPDGRIRCVASRAVEGQPVGPHKFHGTRPDDPNDVIPHEHRRELRGYRVFCAWLNHDDSRAANSLDTYVGEAGRGHVRHYLQDFSGILGSGSDWRRDIAPQKLRSGNEYVVELAPALKTILSLGIWQRPWHRFDYAVHPEVGRIEAEHFDPELWKPEYPNPAFERMLPEDAFWAARIVARFTDEGIRAIVNEGDFRAPAAEKHLAGVIIRRRDKVVAHYFSILNPLADFVVTNEPRSSVLSFVNYGEDAGLGKVEAYEYQWFAYDNPTGRRKPLGAASRVEARALPLPAQRPEYLMVRVRTFAPGVEAWQKNVEIYLRTDPLLTVVGIDRETDQPR